MCVLFVPLPPLRVADSVETELKTALQELFESVSLPKNPLTVFDVATYGRGARKARIMCAHRALCVAALDCANILVGCGACWRLQQQGWAL